MLHDVDLGTFQNVSLSNPLNMKRSQNAKDNHAGKYMQFIFDAQTSKIPGSHG